MKTQDYCISAGTISQCLSPLFPCIFPHGGHSLSGLPAAREGKDGRRTFAGQRFLLEYPMPSTHLQQSRSALRRQGLVRLTGRWVMLLLLVYVLTAYIILPNVLSHYAHHPQMEAFPKTSFTKAGLPGDPLNVGLVGERAEVIDAMSKAGWVQADPLKLKTDLKIVESVVLKKSYATAPVSRLYLFGRPQDFTFEKQVNGTPKSRHHVRFWRTTVNGEGGRPLWLGAATFDRGVGVSHETGQVTHHIAPDVDAERDLLFADLERARQLTRLYQISGIGPVISGRNGGGDRYFSDGEMTIGVVAPGNRPAKRTPVMEANPPLVNLKNSLWQMARPMLNNQ